MQANRELLDRLMGADRDGVQIKREVTDFRDSRVCKSYLLGFCVHDILAETKYVIGPCPKIHDPLLKKAYEEDPNRSSYNYEVILLSELRTQIQHCERRLKKGVDRYRTETLDSLIKVEEFDDVKQLGDEINTLQDQVYELMHIGKTQAANDLQQAVNDKIEIKASLQAMHLKEEQTKLPPEITPLNATPAQKTRICNICGGMLSIFDVDQRLADHFIGKSHIAFLAIRRKLKQLEEMDLPDPRKIELQREYHHSHSRSRSGSRSHSRSHSRSRSDSRSHSRSDRRRRHRDDYRSSRRYSRSRSRSSHYSRRSRHH